MECNDIGRKQISGEQAALPSGFSVTTGAEIGMEGIEHGGEKHGFKPDKSGFILESINYWPCDPGQ